MGKAVSFLCILGIFVCCYALKVEWDHEAHKESGSLQPFKAGCDMSFFGFSASCSEVFSSEYGKIVSYLAKKFGVGYLVVGDDAPLKILDQPNAMWGLIMYPIIFFFNLLGLDGLIFYINTFMALMSVYLGSKLVEMGDFCIVCTSIYLINFLLFFSTLGGGKAEKKVQRARKVD